MTQEQERLIEDEPPLAELQRLGQEFDAENEALMTKETNSLIEREVHAYDGGELVGIYAGNLRRAASWARRANPHARLVVRTTLQQTNKESGK